MLSYQDWVSLVCYFNQVEVNFSLIPVSVRVGCPHPKSKESTCFSDLCYFHNLIMYMFKLFDDLALVIYLYHFGKLKTWKH